MQNQISLFQNSSSTDKLENKGQRTPNKESKRPSKLDLSALQPHRQKWAECKIYGKNILIRSYSGACRVGEEIYVYGGLQLLNGVLGDFQKINIKPKQNTLLWKMVEVKKGVSPGARAKHALISHKNKIYLIGGIKSSVEISNQIFVYDIENCQWTKMSPSGCELPPLQTFGAVLVDNDHPKIITICGYNGKLCQSTNAAYSYDILSNSVQILYQHSPGKGTHPSPRLGCGVTFNGKQKIYLFGGKSQEQRLNDFWQFDINTKKYSKVYQDEVFRPVIRNGHSMTYYNGKIFLYGGIHDITWELDDLHIYDIQRKEWMVLQTDSARKKKDTTPVIQNQLELNKKERKDSEVNQQKKKSMTHSGISPGFNNPRRLQHNIHEVQETQSPTKTTNQLKYKAFLNKKTQMLKNFEVKQQQKQRFLSIQPSSQAMKNSLDMIGNGLISPQSPTRIKKSDLSKTTYSKFMEPLVITTCFIPGKKPCARDGHNAILVDKDLVFFGGDRHHMSFNDMYVLHLQAVLQQLPKY